MPLLASPESLNSFSVPISLGPHPERINNIEDKIPYPADHTHFIDGGQYVSFLMRESPNKRNH